MICSGKSGSENKRFSMAYDNITMTCLENQRFSKKTFATWISRFPSYINPYGMIIRRR